MPKLDRADISPAALARLADVFIDFVQECIKWRERTPFAWCWWDHATERYEFVLRKEDAPENARPLFTALEQ